MSLLNRLIQAEQALIHKKKPDQSIENRWKSDGDDAVRVITPEGGKTNADIK